MTFGNPELFAAEEWYSASYHGRDGQVYDVVFTKSYMHDIGYESRELANVLLDGDTVEGDDLWRRIRDELEQLEMEEGGDIK